MCVCIGVAVCARPLRRIVIVCVASRPSSVQLKREIDTKVTLPNGKPLPVLLLGNKVRVAWI